MAEYKLMQRVMSNIQEILDIRGLSWIASERRFYSGPFQRHTLIPQMFLLPRAVTEMSITVERNFVELIEKMIHWLWVNNTGEFDAVHLETKLVQTGERLFSLEGYLHLYKGSDPLDEIIKEFEQLAIF